MSDSYQDTALIDGPPQAQAARAPTRAGRYQLLKEIGRGGMGTVHLGYDLDLDRKVAIKLMHGGGGADRLLREAQALARLSHPNVVTVHEVGLEGGDVFVAMEFIEGPTLSSWAKRPHPWREILRVFTQAGRGLAAAHARELVHRDFKPQNVILGDDGRTRVLDFGLARSAGPTETTAEPIDANISGSNDSLLSVSVTVAGQVMGTPAYMAPEQFRGGRVDGRTDQFAFCIALHEALFGERPFAGRTAKELAANVRTGKLRPEPKSTGVPSWVRRVIMRGLETAPDKRWPSMEALLAALGRDPSGRRRLMLGVGAGAILLATASSVAYQRGTNEVSICAGGGERVGLVWSARRSGDLADGFAASGVHGSVATWERAAGRIDDYAAAWSAMHREACEATRVHGSQSDQLLDLRMSCLDSHRDELDALLDVFADPDEELVQRAVRAVSELPGLRDCADIERLTSGVVAPGDPETAKQVAGLRRSLVDATALERAGRYEAGVGAAEGVVATTRDLDYVPVTAEALLTLGNLRRRSGDYPGAEAALQEAFWLAAGGTHEEVATDAALALVVVVGYLQGRPSDAAIWEEHAQLQVKRMGNDPAREAEMLSGRATLAAIGGELEVARERYERALELRTSLSDKPTLAVAGILNNLGNVAMAAEQIEQAKSYQERALEIERSILGADHPEVSHTLENLGSIALAMEELGTAKHYYEASLKIRQRTLGPEHPRIAGVYNNLGVVARAQGDEDLARDYYERALALREKTLGPNHPQTARSLSNVANAFDREERYAEATAYRERALAILDDTLGSDHPAVLEPLEGLGLARLRDGRATESIEYFERALKISGDLEQTPYVNFGLAKALRATDGDMERARVLAEAARDAFAKQSDATQEHEEAERWLRKNAARP